MNLLGTEPPEPCNFTELTWSLPWLRAHFSRGCGASEPCSRRWEMGIVTGCDVLLLET